MLNFSFLLVGFLLTACSSTQQPSVKDTNEASSSLTPQALLAERWVMAVEQLSKNYVQQKVQLEVDYETYLTFAPNKIIKTTVCHFKSPVIKTLVVDTESPAVIDGKTIKVLGPSSQKQDYNVTLKPKSGKGPNIKRSVYCTSAIEPKTYNYELEGEELILKPVEEILKLKKYKQN